MYLLVIPKALLNGVFNFRIFSLILGGDFLYVTYYTEFPFGGPG
jgi:hypothetical protein